MERSPRKRTRSRSGSPPPWRRTNKSSKYENGHGQTGAPRSQGYGRPRGGFQGQLQRKNLEEEERQMKGWLSQEDDFVLKQSKKKAKIRIREGRAKVIDQLVFMLSILDSNKDPLEDGLDDLELEIKEPMGLLEGLATSELEDLEQEIEHYLTLEHDEVNITYWQALKTALQHRLQQLVSRNTARGIGTVSADVDRLLGPKTLEQLQALQSQVHQKLRSDEDIDEEYWEQLLDSISLYKAKAHLQALYTSVNRSRLKDFRQQQINAAHQAQLSMKGKSNSNDNPGNTIDTADSDKHDPPSLLKLGPEDKNLAIADEDEFNNEIASARVKVAKLGYITANTPQSKNTAARETARVQAARSDNDQHSLTTHAMYDREAAKGVEEDEEVFAGEAEVTLEQNPLWTGKYRPRKPKHFNRVQMGYEWNKYNQTHYDHENPPPKVVQGYKFNIFYPDLIDPAKAPTYRIERENGRKKGQSFAPAGEEDTCLIRFISGPPYEDIAFRIVDREWDYSAKRERGFKSSFDRGILQLHFQFKKIHYRK